MNRSERLTRGLEIILNNERFIAVLTFIAYFIICLKTLISDGSAVDSIISTTSGSIIIVAVLVYLSLKNKRAITNTFKERFKEIFKEILVFLIIMALQYLLMRIIVPGKPSNQKAINEKFIVDPYTIIAEAVILAPIYEEVIFRYFPSKFIKNKVLYVIISGFLFAFLHVVNDKNWMIYIWAYLISSLYYSYRYIKTKNLMVTVALHRFNNLLSSLVMIMYFAK